MKIVIKILVSLIALAICLLPTWVFLFIKNALSPEGFWQKFVICGAGIWFLGGIQFMALIAVAFLIIVIIDFE